jgi:predicted CXXCH cytochrome family protein
MLKQGLLAAAAVVWVGATWMSASQTAAPAAAPPAAQAVPVPAPAVDPATAYQGDIHQLSGVTCANCHGAGTPGPIERTKIAGLCATCHSDPTYMRKFRPQVRTDQHAQYLTSVHGMQMAKGETRVATCSDCHASHGVLPVKDARSPVAPSNVANTCARCHADSNRMTPFARDPAVFDDWSHSVHAAALLQRGDTSAPTCSTCHGSHGATPPGIDAVANVCSTCHVREAELYHASTKRAAFEAAELPACLACHGNHKIEHPQDAWIDLKEPALCATCHNEEMAGVSVIKTMRTGFDTLNAQYESARALLERAEHAGMLVDDGMAALLAATEQRVRLRVQVHAFAEAPFKESLDLGLAATAKAQAAGDSAMAEMAFRRWGLGLATLAILGFLLTLALKIRSLPPTGPPEG